MRLLVVEDDPSVAGLLYEGLSQERHVIDVVHNGQDALAYGLSGVYDAIVLDAMLPGADGWQVAAGLRDSQIDTPILMLTARDSLSDRLRGFDAGADDYLAKPFAFEELLARLKAITKRTGRAEDEDDRLVIGDLVLDRKSHEVTRAGRLLELAPKEFQLLEYLMRHPNQALSRTLILERVWDFNFGSFANVVDATIRRLRRAVDDDFDTPLIHTVRGVGYKIKAPE